MTAAGLLTIQPRDVGDVGPAPGVDWRVELNYYNELAALALWDSAKWDTAGAVWTGPAPPTDIACDVLGVNLDRGRDEPLSRFRPGFATVAVDDPDGNLSPWSTASSPNQYAAIRPGIGLTVTAVYAGVDYPRFVGTVTAITDTFPSPISGGHVVTFTAADSLADLAAFDGLEQSPIGAGETAGPRIQRIVENAGYDGDLDLADGSVPLQPTTLAGNALDECGLVCDTELGALFVDRGGVLQFVDRSDLTTNPKYTDIQATFGEVAPELCYADVELATDSERVRNVVSIANAGGTAVTHLDATSLALYGRRTYQRFDLIHANAADSDTIADRYLAVYANASRRVEAITILPSVNPETIPAALDLSLLYRIQVRRRATGFQVIADLQIQAIAEEITPREWRLTYRTFSAAGVFAAARWDVAVFDSGLWGF